MTFCAPTMSQARLIYSCALEHSTGVPQAIIQVSSRCDTEDHAQPDSDYKVCHPVRRLGLRHIVVAPG